MIAADALARLEATAKAQIVTAVNALTDWCRVVAGAPMGKAEILIAERDYGYVCGVGLGIRAADGSWAKRKAYEFQTNERGTARLMCDVVAAELRRRGVK